VPGGRLRRWSIPVAVAAALAVPASAAKAEILVETGPSKCAQTEHRPQKIFTACTAPAEWVDGLSWSSFDGSEAQGAGTYHYSDCTPSCANYHTFSANVRLYRVRVCPTASEYTRADITATTPAPDRLSRQTIDLACHGGSDGKAPPTEPPAGACQPSVPVFAAVVAVADCIQPLGNGRYRSVGKLRVNGIDFVPAGNGVVTLDVKARSVTARGPGAIKIGFLPVSAWTGALDLNLSTPLRFPLISGGQAPKLLGFPLGADVEGKWDPVSHGASLRTKVALDVLGDRVTGDVTFTTDNDHGLQLDKLDIKLAQLPVKVDPAHHPGEECDPGGSPWPDGFDCVGTAPASDATSQFTWTLQRLPSGVVRLGRVLPLQGVSLHYEKKNNEWDGSGTVSLHDLFPGASRLLPTLGLTAGVTVDPFAFARAGVTVDGFKLPLPGGVTLQKLKVDIHLKPQLAIAGEMTISDGPNIKDKPALSITAGFDYKRGDTQGFSVALNGKLLIAGEAEIGEAHVKYDTTDGGTKVSFGGRLGGSWGPVDAELDIAGDVNPQHVQATGSANLRAFGQGASGNAVVSDAGFGGCGRVDAFFAHFDIGFKHFFADDSTHFDGCDLGGLYTIGNTRATAIAAGSSTRLPAGLSREEFAAVGAAGPPDVVLTGPGGVRIETPVARDQIIFSKPALAVADSGSRTTHFIVANPAAGTWRLEAGGAAPPPVSYQRADPWRDPRIRARVAGSGSRRALIWRLRPQPGETVIFLEQARTVDATLTRPVARRGRVVFRPARGPGGRRRIVALVLKDGMLHDRLTVGSYRASAVRRARPRSASFTIRRGTLTVRWRAVRGASGYEVTVGTGNRHVIRLRAAKGKHQVVLRDLGGLRPRAVTVAAVRDGLVGPAIRAQRRQ
jgi:hypothetical protein